MDMNSPALRESCASRLVEIAARPQALRAFVGLDGFVDEIIHVVDKRQSATAFRRVPTIAKFAQRLAAAAGKSTNVELVNQRTKLGGNGPIMANALATFGLQVTYLGNLGFPQVHPIFSDFSRRARVISIAEPGHTDALEFEDGKIMMGKHSSLAEITWENILARFGREEFRAGLGEADLVAFVNWTMIPFMSQIWDAVLHEFCPTYGGPRRKIFFDLADPEKRSTPDITRALEIVTQFQNHFDVILGLNEKETFAIGEVLGLPKASPDRDGVASLAGAIRQQLRIDTLAVHPVTYALAAGGGSVSVVEGPYVPEPLITTGAGDHFNAGFCLGKLLDFGNEESVLLGVTTSGYYVRTARTPNVNNLVEMLRDWPSR